MNYYGAKELADSFRTVRKNTLIIANEIDEAHYGFRPAPDTRTIGQTLFHISIVSKLTEQIHLVERRSTMEGFDFMGFFGPLIAAEQEPHTKAQIITLLTGEGDRFGKWVETLTDEFLGERVNLPPGMTPASKTRFEMIMGVKEHEMHHRGQLMLMERMIGMVPHLTREMMARFAAMQAGKASA